RFGQCRRCNSLTRTVLQHFCKRLENLLATGNLGTGGDHRVSALVVRRCNANRQKIGCEHPTAWSLATSSGYFHLYIADRFNNDALGAPLSVGQTFSFPTIF